LCACGASAAPNPAVSAAEFARAIEQGNASQLYESLNAASRSRISERQFAALLLDVKRDLGERYTSFGKEPKVVTQSAVVTYPDGRQVDLVYEPDGVYRVQSPFAGLRTPEDTLRALGRALTLRNLPAAMRLMSREMQKDLVDYLDSLSESLRYPETLEIRLEGTSARVHTRLGRTLRLTQDRGLWKLDDLE
jgi:hypothetical protein